MTAEVLMVGPGEVGAESWAERDQLRNRRPARPGPSPVTGPRVQSRPFREK